MIMPRRGAPFKNIDIEQFEKLCGLQCTKAEIAAFFHVNHELISRWCRRTYGKEFKEVYEEKRGIGKVSLRRMQWRMAETHPNMAIFLGKNYLNQCDDPLKHQKSETTEDKLGKMLDALTDAIIVSTPEPKDDILDNPPDADGDDYEEDDGDDGEA
jgi:hypothetical protein